ncbi:MAG: CHAD domain-containing protein [Acidimicrobiia bacterium]
MASPKGFREREVKLSAHWTFTVPDLGGLADGVDAEPLPERILDATYYDTADFRLARWGASLRHRTGDGSGWTVKLPEGQDGPVLVRRELPFAGGPGEPPGEAVDLVRAYVRTGALLPVARLQTVRRGVELRDGEGQRLLEVVDDDVTVLDGDRLVARFREVEVEAGDRAPADLFRAVLDCLRDAGAGDLDASPKIVRALGSRAAAGPEVVVPDMGDDPTGAEVVRAAIASSVRRVLEHDAGVRLGDDPEDVHQARVGTRRLRSDLRTFRPLLALDWAEDLRAELRWAAAALGAVRDADVLTERLRAQAAGLPEVDAAGFAPVLRRLADEREAARLALAEAMGSDRYVALLDRLVDAANAPQTTAAAEARAAKSLPPLVARQWRKLRRAVDDLPASPPDDDLHAVRILAKRARYAAEAVAPAAGKPARRLAAAIAEVQGVLGDHHDAIVAEGWLRAAVEEADVAQALALGELIGLQRSAAAHCRKEWRGAWKGADRKKLRKWLR